jgi:hypothetical protein
MAFANRRACIAPNIDAVAIPASDPAIDNYSFTLLSDANGYGRICW